MDRDDAINRPFDEGDIPGFVAGATGPDMGDDPYTLDRWAAGDDVRLHEDRAVLARIGGNVYRHEATIARARGYTRADVDEYMVSEVRHKVNDRKASQRSCLPEAAFSWPIYEAAQVERIIRAVSNG